METKPTDQVKVSKLTIQIGRAAVPLTIEQARQLRDELDALFGKSFPTVTKEIVIRHDYWPWWQPTYTTGEQRIDITCGGTTAAAFAYHIQTTPTTLIMRDGRVTYQASGALDQATLARRIREAK